MRLTGLLVLLLVVVSVLGGCGSSSSGLTKEDLSISKIDDSKAQIEYGMNRSDVEKILGTGEQISPASISYGSDVAVFYRDDKVAGINLGRNSADVFQTTKAIKVGMARSDIKEVYGSDNAQFDTPKSLTYAYDVKEKAFLSDIPKGIETDELINIYMVSIMFDDEENAESIMLIDERMASYLY
ncbi:hypothetical protein [Paenibacillus tarimensis]|uniref:hypothetical protein n=1 Tax=Paenibacillus tarimensis TaxID=416012 RepID=UPI001F3C0DC3|nr:hypothetical protein [Paenibacillus tarimensis]MCF2945111.1 hypothetical protein [Paenibacillus tarimensis]